MTCSPNCPVHKEGLQRGRNFGPLAGRVFRLLSRWWAGCASVVQQAYRRLVTDRAVWALLVVVPAPILQFPGRPQGS